MFPWEFNTGLQSVWLGGPARDADQEITGGFVFMDMSRFQDEPRDGFQNRGWVMSGTETPTSVRGRCVKFQYIIRGLNAEALRIIRVDIDTSGLHGAESEETEPEPDNDTSDNFRSILGREMEDTVGGGASLVKVNTKYPPPSSPGFSPSFSCRPRLSGRRMTRLEVTGWRGG